MDSIAQNWRELSGENNWDGLLNPINFNLRLYLIHYGERAGACESAFNKKKASKAYGHCLYPPNQFFTKLCLQNGNPYKYTVTSFVYALTDKVSVWMGIVAVTTDEGKLALGRRDIMISWRGTMSQIEWDLDIQSNLIPAQDLFGKLDNTRVHSGFHSIYTSSSPLSVFSQTSARDQVLNEIKKLVKKYRDEEISISVTGHSLGASLATLTAIDIVANGCNIKPTGEACMVTAFAFASPRIGDAGLKKVLSRLNHLHILRISNIPDDVPDYPPKEWQYVDLGEELKIDSTRSIYLKPEVNSHEIEVYLHGIAGMQEDGKFKLAVDRDISLVNKAQDALKDEYGVPVAWWANDKNNNMVQMDNGFWKLEEYIPDPPNTTSGQ